MIALLLVLAQTQGWVAAPAQPTVGDTISLEKTLAAPPGWRIRAGKLASTSDAEPLGDPVVLASAGPGEGEWLVRYAVVAWTPGAITLEMPPVWRLGPDGTTDSLPGGTATLRIASVIPDSVKSPAPQPALGLLRPERLSALPLAIAGVLAVGALIGLVAWRRRKPRALPEAARPALATEAEVSDARWLSAGEPKAVAARAAHRLRHALARSIPEANEALSTAECLAAIARARPDAPLRDLRELLTALDQVAFAAAHGIDVAPLAARARALARELAGMVKTNGSAAAKS